MTGESRDLDSLSAAYVSNFKSVNKVGKKTKEGAPRKAMWGRRGPRNGGADNISMSSLVKTKKLADELGGVEKANAMLDALAKLTG